MEKKLKVIVANVGELPEVKEIDNTTEARREIVGGWIESVMLGGNVVLWVNEEGMIRDLPINFLTFVQENHGLLPVHEIYGNVFFTSLDESGDMCSLSDDDIDRIRFMFRMDRRACIVR